MRETLNITELQQREPKHIVLLTDSLEMDQFAGLSLT